jgi:para-nitrobenzyl esterase
MIALSHVAVVLLMGMAAQDAPAQDTITAIRWNVVELAGTLVSTLAPNRQANLTLDAKGRFSGSDGCNRVSGGYTLKGEAVTFGQALTTQMACPGMDELARRFQGALAGTSHWQLIDGRLQFFGATGKPLAILERAAPAALPGTSWQLVKFQGGDGKTMTPDAGIYTVEFAADGSVSVRLDCNRGRGTWKSIGANQIELGPLALTRAMCPNPALHDQIARQWTAIRSFLIKDGDLFLTLTDDGGSYEFRPAGVRR